DNRRISGITTLTREWSSVKIHSLIVVPRYHLREKATERRRPVMAVTRIYRPPVVTTRRVARRKTSRFQPTPRPDSRRAARPRRRVYPVFRSRTLVSALRGLWLRTGGTLRSGFTIQAIVGVAGIVRLVIDCLALHALLIG